MDATWIFETRSVPRATRVTQALAGLVAAAALAGIYPVAATLATTMAATLKIDKTEAPARVAMSTAAAERISLGLQSVRPTVATAHAL